MIRTALKPTRPSDSEDNPSDPPTTQPLLPLDTPIDSNVDKENMANKIFQY